MKKNWQNRENNCVTVPTAVWLQILKTNKFAVLIKTSQTINLFIACTRRVKF